MSISPYPPGEDHLNAWGRRPRDKFWAVVRSGLPTTRLSHWGIFFFWSTKLVGCRNVTKDFVIVHTS